MPMVKEAINQMTVEEKFSTLDYIWASLSADSDRLIPAWHERELRAMKKESQQVLSGQFRGLLPR